MKRTLIMALTLLLLASTAQAQQRDRSVDLTIQCRKTANVSSTGRLWIATRCGEVFTADSIGAAWRTAIKDEALMHIGGATLERIAAFGDKIAVAAGYMHGGDYVLRTTTGGAVWDTVHVDKNLLWVHGFCYHADGRMWMAASSGRKFKCMAYSTDRGQTFTKLMPPFVDPEDGEGGIHELYMVTADSGFAGTYGGGIYSTSDNWRTAHRWANPIEQGLMEKNIYSDSWVNRIRPWRGWLIATLSQSTFCTPMGSSPKWQTLPWATYEVDTVSGNLWAVTDSGQLLYLTDMEHRKVMAEGLSFPFDDIIGTLGGCVYLSTLEGVVRVSPDGRTDTCGFYTEEKTLDEMFDEKKAEYSQYGSEYAAGLFPTFSHGGRLWRTDGTSIYLQDVLGWYRVAKPLGVQEMHPDPDREDRVVILRGNGMNYSVDTNGRIEPYTYRQPLARFLASGLQSVEIQTYVGGCFHFDEQLITYTRKGDLLREKDNTVEKTGHAKRAFPAEALESTLRRLGEVYDRFPTPADFGMQESEVNLHKAFERSGGCTSYSGYRIIFTNRQGDTLRVDGNSDADCGDYFPWMLPMKVASGGERFVTYQPLLWQALKPMMPKGMMHRRFLNNNSLFDLRPGDLLFFRDTSGMGRAVRESTGEYTHVALVESVDDTVWIIDATQRYGVSRRPLDEDAHPDIYRLSGVCCHIDSVLMRARSFVGQPYDDAFLPDNGAMYCSELVYECYLMCNGQHLFNVQPMNWRDKNGKLPEYWKKHFDALDMPVPEGVLGTNPTDLSRSPTLKKL